MKIGFLGLGKLGLPCALAVERYGGHELYGFDASAQVMENIRKRHLPYMEEGAAELLAGTKLRLCADVRELANSVDILFVAVQTPHDPAYEGTTRRPEVNKDFDYAYLRAAVAEVSAVVTRPLVLVVISTVLPGTMRREILPLASEHLHCIYNPFFIAMGTTINDFMNPEFVLIGEDKPGDSRVLQDFYRTLHQQPFAVVSIESAELSKVAYNTYIGLKIIFANTMMEICEKTAADCDQVVDVLSMATGRLLSPRYMRAGMGDGGGCHPRDNIAMSMLAEKLDLSYDLFSTTIEAREKQTEWLADLVEAEAKRTGLPVVLAGISYKPETNLTVGSPALLLENILRERGIVPRLYDPIVGVGTIDGPAVYLISTNHAAFARMQWPQGSVVLDPWRGIGRKPPRLQAPEQHAKA
jgi:UDPglucose 6-dehydrogenase